MLVTRELLTRMGASAAHADRHLDALNAAMAVHGIDTELRIAHFLAQVMHESGCLRLTEENLNYSAEGLRRVFRKYYRSDAEAAAHARQPERIANRVYASRMGNGPESSGDGFRYRGRGLIQLTGKDNYRSFAQWCGADVVANPDWVAERYAVESAVYYWDRNALNALADVDDLGAITRRINGGLIGYEHRLELLRTAKRTLRELAAAGTVDTVAQPAVLQPSHRVGHPAHAAQRAGGRRSHADRRAEPGQGGAGARTRRRARLGAHPCVPERAAARGRGRRALSQGVADQPWCGNRARRPGARPPPFLRHTCSRIVPTSPAAATAVAPIRSAKPAAPRVRAATRRAWRQSVSAIVDYLDVANPAHLRYKPAGGTTYCNIYATDLAYLCGVYLPRVWWTDRALLQLREGAQVAVEYGRTVRELNANSLYDWLEDHGPAFGWRREVELTALQAAANAGQVCVIVARRVDLNRPGHITAVVPETGDAKAVRSAEHEVLRPLESQAGTRNVLRGTPASAWWQGSRFQAFAFWRHP
jgi:predicted chitinase